jgi:hypothetical protein
MWFCGGKQRLRDLEGIAVNGHSHDDLLRGRIGDGGRRPY